MYSRSLLKDIIVKMRFCHDCRCLSVLDIVSTIPLLFSDIDYLEVLNRLQKLQSQVYSRDSILCYLLKPSLASLVVKIIVPNPKIC
jgi:hypothetical protein